MNEKRRQDRKPDHELTESEIFERYKPFLYKYAKSFAKKGMEIEDLVQEGTIALIKSFRSWKPDGGASLLTYIRNPVIRAMNLAVQKKKKESPASVSMDERISRGNSKQGEDGGVVTLHDIIGEFEDPGDLLVQKRLERAIRRLEETQRKVIVLTLEGKTNFEIGEVLGLSRPRVQQIQSTAVKELRCYLQKPPRHLRAV